MPPPRFDSMQVGVENPQDSGSGGGTEPARVLHVSSFNTQLAGYTSTGGIAPVLGLHTRTLGPASHRMKACDGLRNYESGNFAWLSPGSKSHSDLRIALSQLMASGSKYSEMLAKTRFTPLKTVVSAWRPTMIELPQSGGLGLSIDSQASPTGTLSYSISALP